jgi:hypothetical protein
MTISNYRVAKAYKAAAKDLDIIIRNLEIKEKFNV